MSCVLAVNEVAISPSAGLEVSGGGGSAPAEEEENVVDTFLQDTELAAAVQLLTEAMKAPYENCVFFEEQDIIDALVTWNQRMKEKQALTGARGFPGDNLKIEVFNILPYIRST